MNVAAIIESAERDGLLLGLSETGGIKYKGPAEVVSRWLPTLKEHKPEIRAALAAANDQTLTCADCQNFTRYRNCGKPTEAGLSSRFELIGAPDGHANNCEAFEAKP